MFLWRENGKRRSKAVGTKQDLKSKSAAWSAAKPLRDALEEQQLVISSTPAPPTVCALVAQYRDERMPERFSTRYGYEAWLKNHVLPRWGECVITDLKPYEVEMWMRTLNLAPKSLLHIRGVLHQLWEFSMWKGFAPSQENPMKLVQVKGATKRQKKPRSLTIAEFHRFVARLEEPFKTLALVCLCFGLRISECLALKWSDVDWLNARLTVERGIVRQRVGPVKTEESERLIAIDNDVLEMLTRWRQASQFTADTDWIFASPCKHGADPWSYPNIWLKFQKAGTEAGIGKLGTHTMRHSYRSWMDAAQTPIAVQMKMMRHRDIRTTMNTYGDVVTDEMAQANSKVAGMAFSSKTA